VEQRVAILGSEANHNAGGSWRSADANQQASVTIVLRRPQGAIGTQDLLSASTRRMSREEATEYLRANPGDLAAVRSFVSEYGLKIVSENADARTVRLEGPLNKLAKAFNVDIQLRTDERGQEYLSYQGAVTIPATLAGIVQAVLGLDQRPIAHRSIE
jgi:kumamolisin